MHISFPSKAVCFNGCYYFLKQKTCAFKFFWKKNRKEKLYQPMKASEAYSTYYYNLYTTISSTKIRYQDLRQGQ